MLVIVEQEERKKFWRRIMYDGLGGKKGHDN